jgi:hypothetical protein
MEALREEGEPTTLNSLLAMAQPCAQDVSVV